MVNSALQVEIDRLKQEFSGADESKLRVLEALIEQAAYERLYLKELNKKASVSGLVDYHPQNPRVQRTLPVSTEITKHSATLTHILDRLIRHLGAPLDDEDEGLADYE